MNSETNGTGRAFYHLITSALIFILSLIRSLLLVLC